MDRLTKRNGKYVEYSDENYNDSIDNLTMLDKCLRKLADYEDAEEQGLLIRLPVAEGSTVFVLDYTIECKHNFECPLSYDKYKCEEDIRCEHEYKEYYVREAIFNHAMMKSLGKTVFLTKEEAELKLVEMRGE